MTKLTDQEKEKKNLDLMNVGNQLEQQKLHRKQLADKIEANYFQRKAELDLQSMDNEIDRLEKNKQFYEKQLETGDTEPFKQEEQTDSSQESEESKEQPQEDTRTR